MFHNILAQHLLSFDWVQDDIKQYIFSKPKIIVHNLSIQTQILAYITLLEGQNKFLESWIHSYDESVTSTTK